MAKQAINPVANDDDQSKQTMLDLWKKSIERSAQKRETVTQSSAASGQQDIRRKIQSGQMECPTCKNRQYVDQSDDGGVSFQAPRSMNAATAGSAVMNHEWEHVAAEDAKSRGSGDLRLTNQTVSLQYAKCPDCGKTYVAGGLTKTQSQTIPSRKQSPGGMDMSV
jgi:predicted RNA-binding Zn-ribbon protein involved in translation (DUF1610 family)